MRQGSTLHHFSVTTDCPTIAPLGEAALLMTFGSAMSRALARRLRHIADRIGRASIDGVTDVVTSYTTIAVYVEPTVTTVAELESRLIPLLSEPLGDDREVQREIVIPVLYDGPDLDAVAAATKLSVAEVIERHSAPQYYAYTTGFVPGFAYLGELDSSLILPRRSTPRQRVPAGTVAIAGAQTAVYPLHTPGGWHLLGTTTMTLFDPHRDPPAHIRPGDLVRFEPLR